MGRPARRPERTQSCSYVCGSAIGGLLETVSNDGEEVEEYVAIAVAVEVAAVAADK
jgi:hypothetical protein